MHSGWCAGSRGLAEGNSRPITRSYRTFLSRDSRGAFARFPEHKVPWPPGSTRQHRIRGCVKPLTATEHVDQSSPQRPSLKAARVVSPMYGGPERRSGYAPEAKRRFHTASIQQMTDAHLLAANARGERHRWCRNAPPARLISQANNSLSGLADVDLAGPQGRVPPREARYHRNAAGFHTGQRQGDPSVRRKWPRTRHHLRANQNSHRGGRHCAPVYDRQCRGGTGRFATTCHGTFARR
jgi:hypothetical protein